MRFNFSGYFAFSEMIAKNENFQKIGKNWRPPFRPKENIFKYMVYGIEKNRLCNTVPTKQSIN